MSLRVTNLTRGRGVADRVERAEGLLGRAAGLLFRSSLGPGEGLWIEPCRQIHTCFMSFPIDAVFLDRERRVLRIYQNLVPWRLSAWLWRARGVLELPAGGSRGAAGPGDHLQFHE